MQCGTVYAVDRDKTGGDGIKCLLGAVWSASVYNIKVVSLSFIGTLF